MNNAGVMTRPVPITELEVKKWDYTIAVNLRGPFLVTKSVLPVIYQRFTDGGTRRVRKFHRLCDIKMGTGRIHSDPGGGDPFFEHPDQLRITRLRRNKVNRLQRQSTRIGNRCFCLSGIRSSKRHHRQDAELLRMEVSDEITAPAVLFDSAGVHTSSPRRHTARVNLVEQAIIDELLHEAVVDKFSDESLGRLPEDS